VTARGWAFVDLRCERHAACDNGYGREKPELLPLRRVFGARWTRIALNFGRECLNLPKRYAMAARQDQGLVFTLIAFVILFIISFVAAYVGWKSYGESETHVAELENQKREADAAVRNSTDENQRFRKMIGLGENDSAEDVDTTFKEDMQRYGSNFGEDRQSYRNILEYLAKENESISAREVAAKDQLKEVKDRLLAVEGEKEKQVVQFEAQMKAAEEDAASQRSLFKRDRDTLEATKQELIDNLDKQESRYEAQLTEINTQLKGLTDKLTKSERAKENLLAEVSKSAESFEVPDGRISWVNQNGTVWINLGAADSLRRQITFSRSHEFSAITWPRHASRTTTRGTQS
jgi:hypothetical protein